MKIRDREKENFFSKKVKQNKENEMKLFYVFVSWIWMNACIKKKYDDEEEEEIDQFYSFIYI